MPRRDVRIGRLTRFIGRCRRLNSMNIETILRAAESGILDRFLTEHYTIYTDEAWQEKLRLCRDSAEAGYLKAEFQGHFGQSPVFFTGEPRITVPGHEYLQRIKRNKLSRRLLVTIGVFLLGLASSSVVELLDLVIELFAKKYGLRQ